MATLVQFLVAGVKGAESGSATFLVRGSASSGAGSLWNDFEQTAQPGTNVITLDANGAAEVYCTSYLDCTIRSSAGTILRTVTVGSSFGTVEVRSQSFTGTAYDGDPTAVGEPIRLSDVLDLWRFSADAPDFKVDIDGVDTDLSEAFGSVGGMVVNVKDPTFGAEGDGVTNDATAIAAAFAAADGKEVFFPPGTYLVAGVLTLSGANVAMRGAPGTVELRGTTSGTSVLSFTDNTGGTKSLVGINLSSANARNQLIRLEESQTVYIDKCDLDTTNCTAAGIIRVAGTGLTRIFISDSTFTVDTVDACIENQADDSDTSIHIKDCYFTVAAGFTGDVLSGPDYTMTGSTIDGSAVTAGEYYHVSPGSNETSGNYRGRFVGNTFIDGSSDGFAFYLRAVNIVSSFVESDNTFTGFAGHSSLTDEGNIYDFTAAAQSQGTSLILGSRRSRALSFINSALDDVNVSAMLTSETVIIMHANASDLIVQPQGSEMPVGSDWSIVVYNGSGGARDITFHDTAGSHIESAVADGGMAVAYYHQFPEPGANSRCNIVTTTKESA